LKNKKGKNSIADKEKHIPKYCGGGKNGKVKGKRSDAKRRISEGSRGKPPTAGILEVQVGRPGFTEDQGKA